jgi:cyclase
VLGVDSFARDGAYYVHQYTGRPDKSRDTGRSTLDWVREAVDRGAGEIVLNCMRRDGVRSGYDLDHVAATVEAVTVPVIASGGAGAPEHFRDVFVETGASGALAATVFHDRLIAIPELKEYLARCGIEVRR